MIPLNTEADAVAPVPPPPDIVIVGTVLNPLPPFVIVIEETYLEYSGILLDIKNLLF
jgi:hypothetical protein